MHSERSCIFHLKTGAAPVVDSLVYLLDFPKRFFGSCCGFVNRDDRYFHFFSHIPLLQDLPEEEIAILCALSKEIALRKGDFLVKEGEAAKDIFFILEGELRVLRHDQETDTQYVIDTLKTGDSVGEIALLDRGNRSASVQAIVPTKILAISFQDLEKAVEQNKELLNIYLKLSKNITGRLRRSNETTVASLKREAAEYKTRVQVGQFLVTIVFILSFFSFLVRPLKYALQNAENTSYVSIPLIVGLFIFFYFVIHAAEMPFSFFGITLHKWKQAVFDGFVLPIPLMVLIVLFKWLFTYYHPLYIGRSVFEPFALIKDPEYQTLFYWLGLNVLYCFFVPIQELMVRGALQGLLTKFLVGKSNVLIAIVTSNLLFCSLHLIFSEEVALFIFIGGLYLGWMYTRTYNLIGVTIAHCILGIWMLSVVGPSL